MSMNNGFDGLRVTSFESRRSKEIAKLISYHGGVPRLAPSMKEIPVDETPGLLEFAKDLLDGKIDILILMTGVGTRFLSKQIIARYNSNEFVDAIKNTMIVARGPKPVAALKELKLKPNITIPEPNTWRDILKTIDQELDVDGKVVAVQEYGVSNKRFLKDLKVRGAEVKPITIYKWGLPEDLDPLKDAIRSISDGNEDLILFTSSQQVVNLIDVASKEGRIESLLDGFKRLLVGSIGPTTTETLSGYNISVDYEPDSPKMGNLIREIARVSHDLLNKKRIADECGVETLNWKKIDMLWSNSKDLNKKKNISESQFMKACRREKTDYTPIWIMRQAGRYLREYRDIRSKVSFLDLCKRPELAAEVTLMAVDRLQVDAAIIFSDILLILEPLGLKVVYSKNDGPLIKKFIRSSKTVDSLKEFDSDELGYVYDAIRITRRALDPSKALIGFAGAPFTVASYTIEGGGSRNYLNTKGLMYKDPVLWDVLLTKFTDATADHLNKQIEFGADAVQIFDSWVGCLSPNDYKEFVLPHMKRLIGKLPANTPVILFGTVTSSLLELIKETGCSVIGLDWRVNIEEGWSRVGYDLAIQGNLDPVCLLSSQSYVKKSAEKILEEVDGRAGYIFNLGHGVLPNTPVDNVLTLVDTVHEYSAKKND